MNDLTEQQRRVVMALRERYTEVHEVVFRRTVGLVRTETELFDALEAMPASLPLMWDDTTRRWRAVATPLGPAG
jgi:hypothetical protein